VECKRTFCKNCADSVQTCAVCDEPVCVHSLVRCKTCGRETCQKHAELCHAVDGEPQRMAKVEQEATATSPPAAARLPAPSPAPEAGQAARRKRPPKYSKTPPAKSVKKAKPAKRPKGVVGQRVQVEVELNQAAITAFVLYKEREVAVRHWELTAEGILVHCHCEKGWSCAIDGLVYRPAQADQIERQVLDMIRALAQEYQVPEKKIGFLRMIGGQGYEERRLNLSKAWKDTEALAQALAGFERLSRKR
jgi:hypothetical protein